MIGDAPLPAVPGRTSWRGRVVAAGFALLGLALFGDGLYIKAKAALAQVLLERAWSETLQSGQPVRPWAWIDTWPVARISVPGLNKSAIVLHGTSGQAMAFGPGLMSAGPQPGQPGLAILSAHRDTHFRFLKDVQLGDAIQVETPDAMTHTFQIIDLRVVDADQSGLIFDHDTPLIALSTCWPFDALQTGNKRYVVIGELVATDSGARAPI